MYPSTVESERRDRQVHRVTETREIETRSQKILLDSTLRNLFTLSRTAEYLSTFLVASHIPDLLFRIENEGC